MKVERERRVNKSRERVKKKQTKFAWNATKGDQ